MALDRELLEALHKNTETMDKIGQLNYLAYMAQQKREEHKTPSSTVFGSYNFNPYNDANITVQWRQVVPRNSRRAKVIFSALNQTLFLATSDNSITIDNLVSLQNTGWNGSIPVMIYTFTAYNDLPLETTEAIYIASLTGAGSMKEQTAVISWAEEIYSDVTATPFDNHDRPLHNVGEVGNLTSGLMGFDRDDSYTREGVR